MSQKRVFHKDRQVIVLDEDKTAVGLLVDKDGRLTTVRHIENCEAPALLASGYVESFDDII